MTKDNLWKIIPMIMSILVMPLAGWVWNTNVKVAELENNLAHLEKALSEITQKQEESNENSKVLIGFEKDIEYMQSSLTRIEKLVAQ